ncbi:MAG: hypothetical protein A2854_01185 [Parcubacteria group bacterium RIFCSPHIGHO2_01_FULL_56_18]|nr:MAG: hypothetical protein A2854_01185 [Parcubacteria group bacterium RIFCSPHIGHO2_01_FULL_56_18]
MVKTIYLVRHGEAEHNPTAENIATHYKGGSAELTPRGFLQADKIAERATNLPVQAIIASTMTRAQQTAEVISKSTGISVESSDLFTEWKNPSSFVGLEWKDPETQRLEREWQQTFFTENGARMRDGENFDDINERGKRALALLAKRPEENVLVVTHGVFLRVLVGRIVFGDAFSPMMLKGLYRGFRTANTGLTLVHYDPDDPHCAWWMSLWNDHAHLG